MIFGKRKSIFWEESFLFLNTQSKKAGINLSTGWNVPVYGRKGNKVDHWLDGLFRKSDLSKKMNRCFYFKTLCNLSWTFGELLQ